MQTYFRVKIREFMKILLFSGLTSSLFLTMPTIGMTEDYPVKPIVLHVPAGPGGASGATGQLFAETARKYLPNNQPILTNFRAGASGAVGADHFLKQPRDGYNLLLINVDLISKIAKDGAQLSFGLQDFVVVGSMATTPAVMAVNKDAPFKTFKEFIDHAKKNPGKLSYASAGIGSINHVTGELLQMVCGIQLNHIPFVGGGPQMMTNLIGGHVDSVQIAYSTLKPHVGPGGGARAVSTFSSERWHELPDVPTSLEDGYNLDRASWFHIVVAKGVPQPIVNILRRTIKKVTEDTQVKEALISIGFAPLNLSPEEVEKKAQIEYDVARDIYKKAGILQ